MLEKYSGNIKLVIRHFPLSQHSYAKKAASAAIAANEQGRFWSYHQELFKNFKELDDKKILEIAIEQGLNMTRFNRDVKSSAAEQRIRLDMKDGRDQGVSHVPSVFVDGKLLKDNGLQGLTNAIDAELAKNKKE